MPDFGHDVIFGANLIPSAEQPDRLVERVRAAETAGLDMVGFQDHPYQPAFLDTWTLLSFVAAATDRIRLFPNVINLPLRPAPVLARSAASLDILSHGRLVLGLGAGAFGEAVARMGGPHRSAGENVDALAEAIEVIRRLWTPGQPVSFNGRHYQLDKARPGPPPPHRIEIWLGAYKPRMLELTGRLADGWIPSLGYADPADLPALGARIDLAAEAAGREPRLVRRAYNIAGSFGSGPGFLQGQPRQWAEQLTELTQSAGFSVFLLAAAADDDLPFERFANEVAPAVREAVEKHRRQPAGKRVRPVEVASQADPDPNPIGTAGQQTLIAVHNHLRQELSRLRDVLDQVAAGRTTAEEARNYLNEMTMRQNYWTLGAFCASYCRVVSLHHAIEDQRMFPDLRHKDESLAPVLERLRQEHEVIAAVLNEINAALVAMVGDESRIRDAQAALVHLQQKLLTHLSYEEDKLLEPIGRLGIEP